MEYSIFSRSDISGKIEDQLGPSLYTYEATLVTYNVHLVIELAHEFLKSPQPTQCEPSAEQEI
jgi:hypothetical protein